MCNQRILEKIKSEEGTELKAYKCSAGYWTVGTGHNLESPMSDAVYQLFTDIQKHNILTKQYDKIIITEEQAEDILKEDLKQVELDYKKIFRDYNLNKDAKLVVYDMLFQMGYPTFKKFNNTIQYLKDGNYDMASKEILLGSDPKDPSEYLKDTPHRALRNSEILESIDDFTVDTDEIIRKAIEQAEKEMKIK